MRRGFHRGKFPHRTPLFPHVFPFLFSLRISRASRRTVGPFAACGKDGAADGANPRFRDPARQRGLQSGDKRQNGVSEIFATAARPPLAQHTAVAVRYEATVFAVVVRALGGHKPFDRRPFLSRQFAGFGIRHGPAATSGRFGPKFPPSVKFIPRPLFHLRLPGPRPTAAIRPFRTPAPGRSNRRHKALRPRRRAIPVPPRPRLDVSGGGF